MSGATKKRFVLFVKHPLSPDDSASVKILQDGGPALQAHVSLFAVTPENRLSLPEQVHHNTPVLFDIVNAVFSKNAYGVLHSMARRIKTLTERQGPGQAVPMQHKALSLSPAVSDVLGEAYGSAQLTEAAPLLETRSTIGGQGVAGSTCMGNARGCRFDDDWNTATINWDVDTANRYMQDSFGPGTEGEAGGAAWSAQTHTGTTSDSINLERTKLGGDDDAEVLKLIEKREQLDRQFKERQQKGGGTPSASFSLMEPPQSRAERLSGVEGMLSIRPPIGASTKGAKQGDSGVF